MHAQFRVTAGQQEQDRTGWRQDHTSRLLIEPFEQWSIAVVR